MVGSESSGRKGTLAEDTRERDTCLRGALSPKLASHLAGGGSGLDAGQRAGGSVHRVPRQVFMPLDPGLCLHKVPCHLDSGGRINHSCTGPPREPQTSTILLHSNSNQAPDVRTRTYQKEKQSIPICPLDYQALPCSPAPGSEPLTGQHQETKQPGNHCEVPGGLSPALASSLGLQPSPTGRPPHPWAPLRTLHSLACLQSSQVGLTHGSFFLRPPGTPTSLPPRGLRWEQMQLAALSGESCGPKGT